ncbi:MAG: Holliday junction resolvase RuvX [Woeseia sp.]
MPETAPASTVLAFDFGLRRIGAAVGQPITGSASPLGTISNGDSGPDWSGIECLISEWRPHRLVVGLPTREDGSRSAITTAVLQFAADLARFGLTVETVDERYSSIEASARLGQQRQQGLRGRVHKKAVDAAAAVIIAERWLAEHAGSSVRRYTNSAATE